MNRIELNISFSKEAYATYYSNIHEKAKQAHKAEKPRIRDVIAGLAVYAVIYGLLFVTGFGWSWTIYWVHIALVLTYNYLDDRKKSAKTKNNVRKREVEVLQWLEERTQVDQYKVILDDLGVSLVEDDLPTLFLPKEDIKIVVQDEQVIYLAKGHHPTEKSLFFLKDSMTQQDFDLLANYVDTELKDVQRRFFNW